MFFHFLFVSNCCRPIPGKLLESICPYLNSFTANICLANEHSFCPRAKILRAKSVEKGICGGTGQSQNIEEENEAIGWNEYNVKKGT